MKNAECAEILGQIYCELDAASKYKEVLYKAISVLSLFLDEEVAARKQTVLMAGLDGECNA